MGLVRVAFAEFPVESKSILKHVWQVHLIRLVPFSVRRAMSSLGWKKTFWAAWNLI